MRPRWRARAQRRGLGAIASSRAIAIAALAAASIGACKGSSPSSDAPPSPRESPQAKAEPAPLAVGPAPTVSAQPSAFNPDAGPPPEMTRGDRPLPADALSPKEALGFALDATFRTSDPPPPFKGAEVSGAAIEAARKKTEARVAIELSTAHARIVLDGGGFVLPAGTELRARADRYGFALLLPGTDAYRVAAPGTLRALFGERRLDVAPLAVAQVTPRGEGARRAGARTRRVEVSNRVADATFEIAHEPESGEGGPLLCRALLDFMSAPPSTLVCFPDEVPLHVELRWTTRGALVFDASSLVRRGDLVPQAFATPPPSAAFALPAIPPQPSALLVPLAEIAAFRSGPADVPAPAAGRAARASDAPSQGLALVNGADELRLAWLDGVPIAWLAPGARVDLPTLLRGRYGLAWRTWLGDVIEPTQTIVVPGIVETGVTDAGAR